MASNQYLARLLSAAAVLGGLRSAHMWTATRIPFEGYTELARARLTGAGYQAEQAAGQTLSLEQAIDFPSIASWRPGVSLIPGLVLKRPSASPSAPANPWN